ncbi:MAG: FecR family protein [bacterium]
MNSKRYREESETPSAEERRLLEEIKISLTELDQKPSSLSHPLERQIADLLHPLHVDAGFRKQIIDRLDRVENELTRRCYGVGEVVRRDASGARTTLNGRGILSKGEEVGTGTASSLFLELHDGSWVWMGEKTRLKLSDNHQGGFANLEIGEMVFELQPQEKPFLVVTPAGVVRVVGTTFHLKVSGDKSTEIFVKEGRVAFENEKGRQDVKAGECLGVLLDAAPGGASPSPRSFPVPWRDRFAAKLRRIPSDAMDPPEIRALASTNSAFGKWKAFFTSLFSRRR